MFKHPSFQQQNAVVWPSYYKSSPDNPIWDGIQFNFRKDWGQDSRIFLINKLARWLDVNMYLYFANDPFDLYSRDCDDALLFSILSLTKGNHQTINTRAHPIGMKGNNNTFCGHSMLQHGLGGEPMIIFHPFKIREDIFAIKFEYEMVPEESSDRVVNVEHAGSLFRNFEPTPQCYNFQHVFPVGHVHHDEFSVRLVKSGADNMNDEYLLVCGGFLTYCFLDELFQTFKRSISIVFFFPPFTLHTVPYDVDMDFSGISVSNAPQFFSHEAMIRKRGGRLKI
jgi:hypothetical protein